MRLPPQLEYPAYYRNLRFRLDCGREVSVEECYVSLSTLGYLEGSIESIRDPIIRDIPERVEKHIGGHRSVFIKPVPEGELPVYTFMVFLVCYQPVADPNMELSTLVVCWLGDDIDTSLPELIDREICSVDWDKYALDGGI